MSEENLKYSTIEEIEDETPKDLSYEKYKLL